MDSLLDFLHTMTVHDVLGLVGVVMGVTAYARVQWQRDFAKTVAYSLLNLVGSSLLIVSILHKWNVAAFVSNFSWVIISLYGLYRCLKYRRREQAEKSVAE